MTYVFVIFTCNLNLLINLLLQYNSRVIRLCLSIWNRSPEAYSELSQSGMIKLPSGRLLQYYKNAVPQHEGFNEDVLHWMEQEATKMKLSKEGKCGGIILDEISIQVYKSNVYYDVNGFV